MFRYGEVLKKLRALRRQFEKDKNPKVRAAAEFLLANSSKHFLPAGLHKCVIHTDLKISNFVLRRKRALVMVYWGSVQKLSSFYDLGAVLRLLCGKEEDDPGNKFAMLKYRAFLGGCFAA